MSDREPCTDEDPGTDEDESWLRSMAHAPALAIPGLEDEQRPPPSIAEFRIERRLGRGASAEVWLAHDTLLDRPVALKLSTHEVSEEARARFRMEALAVARLQHPNVLTVHQSGEFAGRPYLVTEVLRGESLAALDSPLEPARVLAIGLDLARGLAAAHRAGVLHRDVKPANAFLCDDGTAKLLDFGLAALDETGPHDPGGGIGARLRSEGLNAGSGHVVGTPRYMAPEAWRGSPPTARTDVYSLGAVLFELLAGRPPCAGDSAGELRARALAGDIGDLAAFAPSATPRLVELVLRCLKLEPAERPGAGELCDALVLAALTDDALGAGDESASTSRLAADTNPYRGLLSFGPEDRAFFFGREAETAAILSELRAHPLVLIVGPSGTGKSSILSAGVVPSALRALGRQALIVRPGHRPLAALARALAPLVDRGEAEIVTRLVACPASLVREIAGAGRRLLVALDPLEEVWTQASLQERSDLFAALGGLVESGPTVRIVAALRSDFLPRLEELGDLRTSMLQAPIVIGALSPAGLRRVIVEPARRLGVTLAPALVEQLVERAHTTSLPLLEFALAELWERRDRDATTLGAEDLDPLGGVEGALAAHAEATLARMSTAERKDVRHLLLALVTVERTRARCEEDELLGESTRSTEVRRVLDVLAKARLVVVSAGERGASYELAHEALLSGWATLRDWLDEESAVREELDRVRRAAAEWRRLGHSREALLADRQLARLDAVAEQAGDNTRGGDGPEIEAPWQRLPLGEQEVAFVAASHGAARLARAQRRGLVWGAPLLLVVAAVAVWGASMRRHSVAVSRLVREATGIQVHAEETARAADALRAEALLRFAKNEVTPAEELWKQWLARDDGADAQRRDASSALELALGIDPRNTAARSLLADVILARMLAAERRGKDSLASSLRGGLALVDDDGTRAARLRAPARVRAETEPPEAALTLARYQDDAVGHRVEVDAAPMTTSATLELEPGSYVIHAQRTGRYATTYPFVVRRGEERTLRIVLPDLAAIPDGVLYVPAGRFLYGSSDGEELRAFFAHQPLDEVELGAFLIAQTEVTYDDYVRFLRAMPAPERATRVSDALDFDARGRAFVRIEGKTVEEDGRFCALGLPCASFGRLPVDAVSRSDAEHYADWLSASGRLPGARLCTDREWERAARGADDRPFPGGVAEPGAADACDLAATGHAGPCAVGSHPASRSPFGADDLVGSVWEWTAGSIDVEKPELACARGGAWFDDGMNLAIPNRGILSSSRLRGFGIRICANAPR